MLAPLRQAYTSAAARREAVACATQLAGGNTKGQSFCDAVDVLCAAFPSIDLAVVRMLLSEHARDADTLLSALCDIAGDRHACVRLCVRLRCGAAFLKCACAYAC